MFYSVPAAIVSTRPSRPKGTGTKWEIAEGKQASKLSPISSQSDGHRLLANHILRSQMACTLVLRNPSDAYSSGATGLPVSAVRR